MTLHLDENLAAAQIFYCRLMLEYVSTTPRVGDRQSTLFAGGKNYHVIFAVINTKTQTISHVKSSILKVLDTLHYQ